MKLGFLGFGEAAYFMAQGLREEGKRDLFAYDLLVTRPESKEYGVLQARAQETGVTLVKSAQELAAAVDCVVSSVQAKYNRAAIEGVLSHMRPGQLLVDVTTDSPTAKRGHGEACTRQGVLYADSAMMGPLPLFRHKVPMLVSGDGAARWQEAMTPFKMAIEVVGATAGDGTRIKLARSIFTKGFEALLVETFTFAHRNGIVDVVMQSLSDTMNKTPFAVTALRYVAGDTVHAERRSHEAEEAATGMRECGMDPLVTEGVAKRLRRTAEQGYRDKLGGKVPETWEEVFQLWDETEYR